MNSNQHNLPTLTPAVLMRLKQMQNGHRLSLSDIVRLCLKRWYYFLISVSVFCGLTLVYLMFTPKVYTRQASILIKQNNETRRSLLTQLSSLSDLDMFDMKSSVDNEIVAIQSPALLLEVVRNLHLDYSYKVDGGLHKQTIYGYNQPVVVDFMDLDESESASVTMMLKKDGSYTLQDFRKNGKEVKAGNVSGEIGTILQTPIGDVLVDSNDSIGVVTENMTIYVERSSMMGAVNASKSRLTAALQNKNAEIINLIYEDVNIQRAEDFLNALIVAYNESWIKDKNRLAISTNKFINERLSVIEEELGGVDNNISDIKSNHLLPDFEMSSFRALDQTNQALNNIAGLTAQLNVARQARKYVAERKNKNELLPANFGITNDWIETQINNYNQQLLVRNNYLASSSERNPIVESMNQKLQEMRNAIIASLDNVIRELSSQLKGQKSLHTQNSDQLANNPNQARTLLSMARQQKVKESLYLFLLQKREENELSQAFTAYNTRIISPPMGAMTPTAPLGGKLLALAFLLGLTVPFIIIYLKENNNSTVRNVRDLDFMTLPLAGEIPWHQDKSRKTVGKKNADRDNCPREIVVNSNSQNPVNEAFRKLRTDIESRLQSCKGQIVMLTGYTQGCGSTFVSMNLAACFALKHQRVLIVDMDMRRSSISNLVNNPSVGLREYLTGTVDELAICHTQQDGLDILPAGTLPPNPADLMYSDRMSELIAYIRRDYDVIFFDCPPIGLVTDSDIVARYSDLTGFVIRWGCMERSMLPQIEEYYTGNKLPNMVLVLNGVL